MSSGARARPAKKRSAAAAAEAGAPAPARAVRVVQVDTRSPYDAAQGPLRTWPARDQVLNHHDMRHRYFEANPVPPRRPYWTVGALQNAWQCRRLGWRHEFAVVAEPPDRHPSWVKIRHLLHSWDGYAPDEVVVVLDTDAWIRDAEGFRHLVDTKLVGDTLYLAAGEPPCPETREHGADAVNGGFMCFRARPEVRAFLQAVWDMPLAAPEVARYARDWPWEQAALSRAHVADVAGCRGWTETLPVALCNTPAGTHVTHCWFKEAAYDLCVDDLLGCMAAELLAVRRPTLEFVVARYGEDVSWVNEWLPFVERVTIYDKGEEPAASWHPKVTVVRLPNVGREAHTYAHHFYERYDDLCDAVVCTQGRFDDHLCHADFDAMVRGREPRGAHGLDVPWSKTVMQHFGWTPEANYAPQPMLPAGCTIAKFFLTHVGDDLVPEAEVRWWPGAIFRAEAAGVRRRARDAYRALAEALGTHPNPETSHMMERFWRALLVPPNY